MRFYTAKVNIGGDRNHVIVKAEMCPAEIMVLQAIHGSGEVYEIKQMPSAGIDRTSQAALKDLLDKRYGKSKIGTGEPRRVLPTVFPGWPNVDLPSDIKVAGIDPHLISDDSTPADTARKAKAQAASNKKAAQKAGDKGDDDTGVGADGGPDGDGGTDIME